MAGSHSDSDSSSSSDDESVVGFGGAPLYAWCPERRASRAEENKDFSSHAQPSVPRLEDSIGKNLTVESAVDKERDPRTPSDQAIQTPAPIKPRRSFSKSTLRAAAKAFAHPTATSADGAAPSLSLSAYPGPAPHILRSVKAAFPCLLLLLHRLPSRKTHRGQTCKLQARIWGLRQGMYSQNEIPPEFLKSFDYDVQELMSNTVKMNQAVDRLTAELKKALTEQGRVRTLESTIRNLEADLSDWKSRSQNAEKTLSCIAGRSDEDVRTIQFLKEQLRQNEMTRTILQEQVNGKRNLWLNVHSEPQDRAAALDTLARSSTPLSGQTFALPPTEQSYASSIRSPPPSLHSSSSHIANGHPSMDRSGSCAFGNVNTSGLYYSGVPQGHGGPFVGYSPFQPIPQSHSGPVVYHGGHSLHQRRPSNTTAASGRSGVGYAAVSRQSSVPPVRPASGPRRNPRAPTTMITETGSPKERKRATPGSLVRADLEGSDLLMSWADEFQSLFALIYGFCASYFDDLPPMNEGWKRQLQSEANGHLWDYICKICHSNHEQTRGENAMRLLNNRNSRPYLMQRLILQHIIVFICSSEGWKDYSEDVDEEMEKLEMRLKKMDPPGSCRTKLFQSRLTFQYVWNDGGTRFATEAHEPLDYVPIGGTGGGGGAGGVGGVTVGVALQNEHARVRFCATPAVTVRNDQGMAIGIRNILKAGVLVMRY
ncbi:predicted protein [Chaetomium globosum CBS 148.51]|uniref:Uncharacterized protein n=1 Tax=Chaetomium globosum (strain ATCC 6205 / CBS 148.51 / DSM 1962 / NBRC 6347 / NRRL 1970) TaxID=306901 RepID=Q2H879_CHAGB|nr:uncharacterized protein CHGG_03575 [Chaetomium globosum CBS 148.51]EAQ91640.1 predicted protein [Chaetomium globosum CBS 148.51]